MSSTVSTSTVVDELVNLSSRLRNAAGEALDDNNDAGVWHLLLEDSRALIAHLEESSPSQPEETLMKCRIIASDVLVGLTMVVERFQNQPIASAVSSVFSTIDLTALAQRLEEIQHGGGNSLETAPRR